MAKVQFNGCDSYIDYLAKLGDKTDDVLRDAVKKGTRIAQSAVKGANSTFSKYVKTKSPKKNEWGWFGQVQIKGTTESGASAGKALLVYEHGRAGQPARPFMNSAISQVEGSIKEEIEKVIEESYKQ